MFRRVVGRPVLLRMDMVAQRRRTRSRCQRRVVSGVASGRSPPRRACGSRLPGPRAARGPPTPASGGTPAGATDHALVVQDQDLGDLPRILTPGRP